MATTMDWATGIFTVYQSDMTFLGGVTYELDTEVLRAELHALQYSVEGITFTDIFFHETETTISGITFARKMVILTPYSMAISPAGGYIVSCKGSNHNLQDVYNNLTGPTFLPNLSAGLVNNTSAAAVASAVWDADRDDHAIPNSIGQKVSRRLTLATESDGRQRESE